MSLGHRVNSREQSQEIQSNKSGARAAKSESSNALTEMEEEIVVKYNIDRDYLRTKTALTTLAMAYSCWKEGRRVLNEAAAAGEYSGHQTTLTTLFVQRTRWNEWDGVFKDAETHKEMKAWLNNPSPKTVAQVWGYGQKANASFNDLKSWITRRNKKTQSTKPAGPK